MNLAHQLLLLALHDERGSILHRASPGLPYGLTGAFLIELALNERIELDGKKIRVVNSSPLNDVYLDEALELIHSNSKEKTLSHWLHKFQRHFKKLRHRLAEDLADKGMLRIEEKQFLKLFPYKRYPQQNAATELGIRHKIRGVVLNNLEPTEDIQGLLGLVRACDLTNEIFERNERKLAKKRIKEISEQDQIGKAVTKIVHETQAAIIAVVVATSAASATSS